MLVDYIVQRPTNYKATPEEEAWLHTGECVDFGKSRYAYLFGKGPIVILAHGWGGAASQWQAIGKDLVAKGYRVAALDFSGHGKSKGVISFKNFATDIADLTAYLGTPVQAYVGHSAGGLGMMAARTLHNIIANHYVCLAVPAYPYPPIQAAHKKLKFSDKVLQAYQRLLAKQFSTQWENISAQCFQPDATGSLNLIYDCDDTYLSGSDAALIQGYWPNSNYLKTQGVGHLGILTSQSCIPAIADFIQKKTG